MSELNLVSPWVNFCKEVEALFRYDSEVTVETDTANMKLKLFVDNESKASALDQLLPAERTFGNVTLKIIVIHPNKKLIAIDLFKTAFDGNGAFSGVTKACTPFGDPMEFVLFEPGVVQYYNDDIGDLNGLRTTIYQEIAKDVFGQIGNIHFCTEPIE